MPRTLSVATSAWSAVFRRVVRQLEDDAGVARVVGRDRIRSWSGVPADKAPFAPELERPILRLTPMPQGVDWYSPDAQLGTLVVKAELAVASLCVDDAIDLWDLVVTALRPGLAALCSDLVALGAETGEIVFSDPAFDPQPEAKPEGVFFATGQFHLRVLRQILAG